MNDHLRYQILKLLDANPAISQRELAQELGVSLGKTNYCIRAVVDKGWVKVRNFRNSGNKAAYLYQLTPRGISAKARVTRRFLDRKIDEYERLKVEIEELRAQVADGQD